MFTTAMKDIAEQLNSISDCGFNFTVNRGSVERCLLNSTQIPITPLGRAELWPIVTKLDPYTTAAAVVGNDTANGSFRYPEIYVNLALEFSEKYCFSQNKCDSVTVDANVANGTTKRKNCLNAEAILLHEVLHVLGLGHISGINCSGIDSNNDSCLTQTQYSLFSPSGEIKADPISCGDPAMINSNLLTCYDQCALRKLYCPDTSPHRLAWARHAADCLVISRVHEAPSCDVNFEIFPTIAVDYISISTDAGLASNPILIYNSWGQLFISTFTSSHVTRIDISKLPSGSYVARLIQGRRLVSASFVITR